MCVYKCVHAYACIASLGIMRSSDLVRFTCGIIHASVVHTQVSANFDEVQTRAGCESQGVNHLIIEAGDQRVDQEDIGGDQS
jgi:hypothetical protein